MKKIIKKIVIGLGLLYTGVSCSSKCELKEIKTLFSLMHTGTDTVYSHYILIKDFSRECMDSSTMVNIALKYADTVTIGLPATELAFYSSDKDFYENETSQDMQAIDRSCLFSLIIDKNTKEFTTFVFYDDQGNRVYWGDRWKPNGKSPLEK